MPSLGQFFSSFTVEGYFRGLGQQSRKSWRCRQPIDRIKIQFVLLRFACLGRACAHKTSDTKAFPKATPTKTLKLFKCSDSPFPSIMRALRQFRLTSQSRKKRWHRQLTSGCGGVHVVDTPIVRRVDNRSQREGGARMGWRTGAVAWFVNKERDSVVFFPLEKRKISCPMTILVTCSTAPSGLSRSSSSACFLGRSACSSRMCCCGLGSRSLWPPPSKK